MKLTFKLMVGSLLAPGLRRNVPHSSLSLISIVLGRPRDALRFHARRFCASSPHARRPSHAFDGPRGLRPHCLSIYVRPHICGHTSAAAEPIASSFRRLHKPLYPEACTYSLLKRHAAPAGCSGTGSARFSTVTYLKSVRGRSEGRTRYARPPTPCDARLARLER
jgi:hypothetical protein